nr:MMPL family transporter [uncultured Agathobaculum sp.]
MSCVFYGENTLDKSLFIGASGATTIVGFLALALMRFGIGPDMGFVLAKGIALSLLTVLLLMPALILRFQNVIAKTQHRSFIPRQWRGFGEFSYKLRKPVLAVVAILILPCYVAQGMADFTYGNEAVANSPGTPVYEAEQQMNDKFGQSNMMLALIPLDGNVTEKAMCEEINNLPYVKYALGLASVLPDGIPEEFLPESLTGMMHGENWARVVINVRSAGESDAAFSYADDIRAIIDRYYPNAQTYLVGVTPSTQDIKDIIVPDNQLVNLVSLLGVALVVAITYKSLLLPVVVLIPIECAVFINTAMPYIYGQRTMFLGFIIVSCIQLGATIDYSILLTGNYLDARAQGNKKEAAIRAVTVSAESILTSGMILMTVAYGLYFMTSVEAVSGLGQLIGRGALISVILVLFLLPGCLMLFDRWIVKPDYAQKKHAKMNRIRSTKLILPVLSELHQQRLRLVAQIRENRRARHREMRKKLAHLFASLCRKSQNTDTSQSQPDNKEDKHDDA